MPRRLALPLSLLWALLCAACANGSAPPTRLDTGPPPRTEPTVRVYLRSFGEWNRIEIGGKGGLVVDDGRTPLTYDEPVVLVRGDHSPAILIEGVEGSRERLFLRAKGNVVTVDGRAYSGEIAVRDGKLINHVPLENYVLGVLRGELPLRDVPEAAAEAQAIAARSYALSYLRRSGSDALFDLDDTILYQVYAGLRYAPSDDNLRAGVQATRGLFLAHEGVPVKAYFHSTCGGHTTDVTTGLNRAPSPVMNGVACDWCKASKYYRWESTLPDAAILGAANLPGEQPVLEVVRRGPGDRVAILRITTNRASREMVASEFRLGAGPSKLRSTLIGSLHRTDGGVRVKGAGWGHGVGLCQMGSIGQARAGRTGREITGYYYAGAAILRAY